VTSPPGQVPLSLVSISLQPHTLQVLLSTLKHTDPVLYRASVPSFDKWSFLPASETSSANDWG
jgi:hypothetical protein